MNWKAHVAIACILSVILFTFLQPPNPFLFLSLVFFAGMSALLPDLDHVNSKGRLMLDRLVPFVAAFFAFNMVCAANVSCLLVSVKEIALLALALAGMYFVAFTYLRPAHRGIVHSIFACAVYLLFIFLIGGLNFALAGLIGYGSHLLADLEIKLF